LSASTGRRAPVGKAANRPLRHRCAPACSGVRRVWLFDLDNTLHDASHRIFRRLNESINDYIERELGLAAQDADALRRHYWRRYGATLLGLERHHGTSAAHYLEYTHRLPGLEEGLRASRADRLALARLSGRRYVLTNAPAHYARRVLDALHLTPLFAGVISIERMRMFGHLRPKPDERMFRFIAARLKVPPTRCVLVEDTLAHQRAAHALGMRTAWMQRYLRGSSHGPEAGVRQGRRPQYVYARIVSLQELRRL
jgi:putative hydrolase of the HAD superfamily